MLPAPPPVEPVRKNRHALLLACLPVVLVTAAGTAAAETLRLKDGTVLVGTRQREADGKVYFKSDALGDLVIDASAIAAPGDGAAPAGGDGATPVGGDGTAKPGGDGAAKPPGGEGAKPGGDAAKPGGDGAAKPGGGPGSGGPGGPGGSGGPGQGAGGAGKSPWSAKISLGGNYTSATFKQGELLPGSGVTGAMAGLPGRQIGAQLTAQIARSVAKYTLALEGKVQYFDIEPLGRQAESYQGAVSVLYHLNDTYYAASRTSLYRDNVKNIDYSFMELLGVGRLLINRPMTKLELTPGVLLLVEGRNLPTDGDPLFGAGALQRFSHAFNPYMMLEQRLLFHTSFTNSEFTGVEAYAGFKGMLSRHLAAQAGFTLTYDRSLAKVPLPLPPGFPDPGVPILANETSQITGMFGLEYSL